MKIVSKFNHGLALAARIGLSGMVRRASYRLYCWKHGLDFSAATHEETGVSRADGIEHAATGGADLEEAFEMLGLKGQFHSVLDIGCGKGAALVTFHRLGVEKLSGIELSAKMLRLCQENLQRMHLHADLMNINATTFHEFDKFDLIYNFNALPRAPLAIVIDNIIASARLSGKEHRVLFSNYLDLNRDLLEREEIICVAKVYRSMSYLYVRVLPQQG